MDIGSIVGGIIGGGAIAGVVGGLVVKALTPAAVKVESAIVGEIASLEKRIHNVEIRHLVEDGIAAVAAKVTAIEPAALAYVQKEIPAAAPLAKTLIDDAVAGVEAQKNT